MGWISGPSTLAIVISALVCASQMLRRMEGGKGQFLLDYADFLESHLEDWTVTTRGTLVPDIKRHFIRILPVDVSDPHAAEDPNNATILIKKASAEANAALGRLDPSVARAIVAACDEILGGRLRDQFVVDVYQAGAGTSHNMNANEVLANRAAELLGEPRGTYRRVHPNDHVNMGQSTNDVFPTSIRLALLAGVVPLTTAARILAESLARKADEFADVLKTFSDPRLRWTGFMVLVSETVKIAYYWVRGWI